ncbi:hypothetical protein ACFYVL_12010 [Streptomyces sp. NPDC004111]|uniref:hypothetical protein n=1 Tax=Streptomyces sp. NPDC004111 TaxID=3364690 RepID=UPI003691C24E
MNSGGGEGPGFWNEETQSWETELPGRPPDRPPEPPAARPAGVPPGAPPVPPPGVPGRRPPEPPPGRPPERPPEHRSPARDSYSSSYSSSSEGLGPHWSYEVTRTAFAVPGSGGAAGTGQPAQEETRGAAPGGAAGRARLRVTPAGAGLVALALVVGAGTAWLVQRTVFEERATGPAGVVATDSRSRGAGEQGKPGPSGPASDGSSPGASPSASPPGESDQGEGPSASASVVASPEVPDGYVVTRDGAGIELAVPRGWRREQGNGDSVFYRHPVSGRAQYLQFWAISEVGLTSRDLLDITVRNRSTSPGYQLVSLGAVPGARHPETEELVFEYESGEAGRRLRLVEWVFRARDGQQYAFLAAAEPGAWPQQRLMLGHVVDFFALPGADAQ